MNPRSLLAVGALLAFLTTPGICPVPAHALRPSMEGVQSGLEEKLNFFRSAAELEEGRNSERLGEKTGSNDEHDAFGADQWRRGLPPKGKPTELLPEQTTSSHSPFLVGASRQASDTQITMPATNTVLNPAESFPKISPANAPANRILEKSASVFDRTSRLPSVSIGLPTASNIPRSWEAISAAGLEGGEAARAIAVAAEAAQGPGVVVIGPEALEARAGPEEMILTALGVPDSALDQMNASGLEEIFTRSRAA